MEKGYKEFQLKSIFYFIALGHLVFTGKPCSRSCSLWKAERSKSTKRNYACCIWAMASSFDI